MPSQDDVAAVRAFVDETLITYSVIVEEGRVLRVAERERLNAALAAFAGQHPERIVAGYAGLDDQAVFDAGVYGEQLLAKRELARIASQELDRSSEHQSRRVFSRRNIRRWLKRAKVLVGSLKNLVPGAEALMELLDLLDGALDPA
jgi:hypothetical protein